MAGEVHRTHAGGHWRRGGAIPRHLLQSPVHVPVEPVSQLQHEAAPGEPHCEALHGSTHCLHVTGLQSDHSQQSDTAK